MEINVQQDQYIGPLSPEAGVRVLLHGQGAMPFPYEEGFSVSTGMATSIGIKKASEMRNDISLLIILSHYFLPFVYPLVKFFFFLDTDFEIRQIQKQKLSVSK